MIHTDFTSENWAYADKKVFIFGGTGGLGSRLARYLARDYDVAKLGSEKVNLLDGDAVKKFIGWDADIIINMAGYNYNSFLHRYKDYTEIDKQINVNIMGNIHILNAALPLMRKNKYGRIIIASSILTP